jgi:hypothetical protein
VDERLINTAGGKPILRPLGKKRPYRLFLSHGGDDTYIVDHFLKPKVEGSGAAVFLDAGEIAYGDDPRKRILKELVECDELLVFLTRSSMRRPWVMAEIGGMLVQGKRIVRRAVRQGDI